MTYAFKVEVADTKSLDYAGVKRLRKILGMLGSAGAGEVVNAGRAADKIVRDAGVPWSDPAS